MKALSHLGGGSEAAAGHPSCLPPVLSLVGDTPLVPLTFADLAMTVYAKCEFLNTSGSIKDRFARMVLLDARQRGALQSDSIIVECSSGNTGIALAMAGTALVTILCDRAERYFSTKLFGCFLIASCLWEGAAFAGWFIGLADTECADFEYMNGDFNNTFPIQSGRIQTCSSTAKRFKAKRQRLR